MEEVEYDYRQLDDEEKDKETAGINLDDIDQNAANMTFNGSTCLTQSEKG